MSAGGRRKGVHRLRRVCEELILGFEGILTKFTGLAGDIRYLLLPEVGELNYDRIWSNINLIIGQHSVARGWLLLGHVSDYRYFPTS